MLFNVDNCVFSNAYDISCSCIFFACVLIRRFRFRLFFSTLNRITVKSQK